MVSRTNKRTNMTQEDKQFEIWKPIPNYEEYEISNLGRVKRLAYDKMEI